MKKSFALILCLVFVISIALVTCVAFVPMNVTQVADADVDSLVGSEPYMLADIAFSDITTYYSTMSSGAAGSLTLRVYSNYSNNSYHRYTYLDSSLYQTSANGFYICWYDANYIGSNCNYYGYFCGSYVNTYHFDSEGWYSGQYRYNNDWDKHFYTKNAVSSDNFDNTNYCLMFEQTPSIASNNVFNVLHYLLNPYPTSDVPIIDEDSHSLLNIGYFYNYVDNLYVSVDNLQLDAVLVENANDHYIIDLNNGVIGVPVDITYHKSVGGVSSVVEQSVILSQIESGADNDVTDDLFYLCLCIPAGVVSFDIKFADGTDVLTIDDTSDTYNAFRDNFSALADTSIDGTYQQGFNAGLEVGAEQADGNNLMSVIWSVFEMPFKLLFGQYDTDVDSPTYQQYVGGLFSFTLLGIDLRAFALSIMSICILIGIFRAIIGFKSGM